MKIRNNKTLKLAGIGGLGALAGWLVGELVIVAMAGMTGEYAPPAMLGNATDAGQFRPDSFEQPTLPFKAELQNRLDREHAKTGDLQVSLMWNNRNDLDLHCIGPDGERIFHDFRKSRTGGELDVDMNARRNPGCRIAMVLDYSGSMEGGRLAEMKSAATRFVKELGSAPPPPGILNRLSARSPRTGNVPSEIAVVQFASDARLAMPFSTDGAAVARGWNGVLPWP
jgi:hypothetical protein